MKEAWYLADDLRQPHMDSAAGYYIMVLLLTFATSPRPTVSGNVAGSSISRNITVPDNCSTLPPSPPSSLSFVGYQYYLLPGLSFDNPSCCPHVTSFRLTGAGDFKVGVLQAIESNIQGFYDIIANNTLYPVRPIHPPLLVKCAAKITIALAIYCNPFASCVFGRTAKKSAKHFVNFFPSTSSSPSHLSFPSEQRSHHPVFSMSFSYPNTCIAQCPASTDKYYPYSLKLQPSTGKSPTPTPIITPTTTPITTPTTTSTRIPTTTPTTIPTKTPTTAPTTTPTNTPTTTPTTTLTTTPTSTKTTSPTTTPRATPTTMNPALTTQQLEIKTKTTLFGVVIGILVVIIVLGVLTVYWKGNLILPFIQKWKIGTADVHSRQTSRVSMHRNPLRIDSIPAPAFDTSTDNAYTSTNLYESAAVTPASLREASSKTRGRACSFYSNMRAASGGDGDSSAAVYASCSNTNRTRQDITEGNIYNRQELLNIQHQEEQTTATSGSLQSDPVYETCGGPDQNGAHSHMTSNVGSLVLTAASPALNTLGIQTTAGKLADSSHTMTVTGTTAISNEAVIPLYDNLVDPATTDHNVCRHLADALTEPTGTSTTCCGVIKATGSVLLLPGNMNTATVARCKASPSDYLIPSDICVDLPAIGSKIKSQPRNGVTDSATEPSTFGDVIETSRVTSSTPRPPGTTEHITMTTSRASPSDYLTPNDIMRMPSLVSSTNRSSQAEEIRSHCVDNSTNVAP